MQEDERRQAQYDPRNKRSGGPRRMTLSFWIVVLLFLALGLTSIIILTHAR